MTVFAILLIHAAATWALVGLIWMVQIVHYPLFSAVGASQFEAYHGRHTRSITFIVAPLMFTELGSAVALLLLKQGNPWLQLSFGLLALNWIATWWIQVPQHHRLSECFDEELVSKLVRGNWLRTLSWSLRGLIVLLVILHWPGLHV